MMKPEIEATWFLANQTLIELTIKHTDGSMTIIEVPSESHARPATIAYDLEIDNDGVVVWQSEYYDYDLKWDEAVKLATSS